MINRPQTVPAMVAMEPNGKFHPTAWNSSSLGGFHPKDSENLRQNVLGIYRPAWTERTPGTSSQKNGLHKRSIIDSAPSLATGHCGQSDCSRICALFLRPRARLGQRNGRGPKERTKENPQAPEEIQKAARNARQGVSLPGAAHFWSFDLEFQVIRSLVCDW